MKAVVVAAGEINESDAAELETADLVVAADGGAAALETFGRRPDLVVGDLDSAEPDLVRRIETAGARVERHPTDKDASDTELAVRAAAAAGAGEIVLLGALGRDRLDHELANVLLLVHSELAALEIRVVRGMETARAARPGRPVGLIGRPGDLVSLLALGRTSGVTTEGLRWPLREAVLTPGSSLGISNEVVAEGASVRLEEGVLLVVERSRSRGGSV